MRVKILFLFTLFFSIMSHAQLPVFDGGYFSNLDYEFTEDWKVDFSEEVIVEVYVFDQGVFEVISASLDPNTNIWLTTGSIDGNEIHNPTELQLHPTWKSRHFYLSDQMLSAANNKIYVHISKQPNNNQDIDGSQIDRWFIARQHPDIIQLDYHYYHSMLDIERRIFVEQYRINLIDQIYNIGFNLRKKMLASRQAAALVGTAMGLMTLDPGTHAVAINPNNANQFIGTINEVQKLGITHVDYLPATILSTFASLGWDLYNLSQGNPFPAVLTIAESFQQLGILTIQTYHMFQNDEEIDAIFILEELIYDVLSQTSFPPNWSNQDLHDLALPIINDLNNAAGCVWWDPSLFYSCEHQDYTRATLEEQFRTAESFFISQRNHLASMAYKFNDVDFDTINNDIEVQEGSNPNDPNSVPNWVTNLYQMYLHH